MKRFFILSLCMYLLLFFSSITGPVSAVYVDSQENEHIHSPENRIEEPVSAEPKPAHEKIDLYARSAVLMDADSGRVLYERDGLKHMPNASTTKILTCILAIESGKMDDVAVASSYAASRPRVRLGMKEGDQFLIRDMVFSLMLESHNDSAVVIAEHIGGSVEGFAKLMNDKAREIGCEDTYFITPNGLDAQDEAGVHGTTARDLSLIMRYCIQNEEFLKITQTATYSFSTVDGLKSHSCYNRNAFLGMMEGALSGKTGFTGNAGYCYVGALRQGDRTFIVSLLACGWPNNKGYKWSDTKELMNYGLDHYFYEDIFEHEKALDQLLVQGGIPPSGKPHDSVAVQPVISDREVNVLKRSDENVNTVYELRDDLRAPIEAGSQIGTVAYFLEGDKICEYPILVEEGIEKIDFSWYFNYLFRHFIF